MELKKAIKAAVKAEQELYWLYTLAGWMELRVITYTWETGKVRTKLVEIYNLKEQLSEVVETQKALGKDAPNNFLKELEEAYWNRVIEIHPRSEQFKQTYGG